MNKFNTLTVCEDLPDPTFGTVTLTGATATYSCKNISRLEGSPQRTCQTDEQWSGNAPQCRYTLTHLSPASHLWDIGKQKSPRFDATERGVPSGAILFA